mmetsp:Transcript_15119/g.34561  ORF Transcript_15119/g.34561 Transcript_15119/m.34561 type:complete len:129 (+) Transcript_15119:127-513(+)
MPASFSDVTSLYVQLRPLACPGLGPRPILQAQMDVIYRPIDSHTAGALVQIQLSVLIQASLSSMLEDLLSEPRLSHGRASLRGGEKAPGSGQRHSAGTLEVCDASLRRLWEAESSRQAPALSMSFRAS